MPRFDQACTACAWTGEVIVAPFEAPPCPACGAATERAWSTSATVRGDDPFIGGVVIENLSHTPVVVHSRAELARETRRRGLEPCVRHVPLPGSDKSPHTTSWAAPSPWMLEQARLLLERVATEPATSVATTLEVGTARGAIARDDVAAVYRELNR